MTDRPTPSAAVRDYLGVLSRRKWLVFATTALVLASTALGTALADPTYKSSTKVALEPTSNRSDLERFLFGGTELSTQQQVLTSRPLVAGVLKRAGVPASPGRVKQFVDDQLTVETIPETTVLFLTVSTKDPERSARLVTDMADAYLTYLRSDADQRLRTALSSLQAQQRTTQQRIDLLEQEVAGASGSVRASLEDERDRQYAELRFVVSRGVELRTASTLARRGVVIEGATVPEEPSSPNLRLNLALGLVLGAMIGVALAFLREWTDDRLNDGNVGGVVESAPVLGRLPAAAASLSPDAATTNAYLRLQTRLLSGSVTPHLRLAVLGAGDDADASAVAVNLAATLLSSGRNVVLVDTTRDGMLGVQERPGLRVVRATVAPRASESSGAALESVLATHDAQPVEVIVVGPPPHVTAGGLEVGRRVGRCLVVVQTGRTTKTDLRRCAEDLRAVGADVSGVVVTEKASRRAPRPAGQAGSAGPAATAISGATV